VSTIARALFRLVLRCFPPKFAETHGGEMADAFGTEVERRSRRDGPFRTAWYVARAVCDAARQGVTRRHSREEQE